jgi:glutathione peroxidase-family protein
LNRVQREDRGGAPLEWNFVKVLIDDRGRVIQRYGPSMDYDKIARDVKEEL